MPFLLSSGEVELPEFMKFIAPFVKKTCTKNGTPMTGAVVEHAMRAEFLSRCVEMTWRLRISSRNH